MCVSDLYADAYFSLFTMSVFSGVSEKNVQFTERVDESSRYGLWKMLPALVIDDTENTRWI